MKQWKTVTEALTDVVQNLVKNHTFVYLALRDDDEEYRVARVAGDPIPAEFSEHQKIVLAPAGQFRLLLRSGECFGLAGGGSGSRRVPEIPAHEVWALGLLWELETTETHHDRLLSNLFHEIRNPVCGILNTTNLLLQKPEVPTSIRDSITLIEESTSTLLQLSGDLLEIHRLKRGLAELKPEPVHLRQCCQAVVDLLHNPLTFQIRLAIHHQVPEWVMLDPNRFKQILMNLLLNSSKYGSSTAIIRCAWQPPQLYFEVEDQGQGISKADYRHIFRLQTNSESGLGIGLLMCKKFLKLMKGDIFVKRSEENEGTTMAFFFEASASANANVVSAEPVVLAPAPPSLSLKILIADDNRSVRESFRQMVHHVVTGPEMVVDLAENGIDAVLKQEERHYDVIFMDLRMPQLRGLEAIFQILVGTSPRPAHIFVVSAYALSPEEKKVCQEWELAGFIQKPFKLEDLRQIFLRVQGHDNR